MINSNTHTHACTHACMHTRTQACTQARTQAHTHACTHTHFHREVWLLLTSPINHCVCVVWIQLLFQSALWFTSPIKHCVVWIQIVIDICCSRWESLYKCQLEGNSRQQRSGDRRIRNLQCDCLFVKNWTLQCWRALELFRGITGESSERWSGENMGFLEHIDSLELNWLVSWRGECVEHSLWYIYCDWQCKHVCAFWIVFCFVCHWSWLHTWGNTIVKAVEVLMCNIV